ncbi:MAG: hypothetical protein EXS68_01755 [Candidatus Ryanbacteria bacterium]|nr:hypothetical protein [Candidatus Ryanbacteria bacterium]
MGFESMPNPNEDSTKTEQREQESERAMKKFEGRIGEYTDAIGEAESLDEIRGVLKSFAVKHERTGEKVVYTESEDSGLVMVLDKVLADIDSIKATISSLSAEELRNYKVAGSTGGEALRQGKSIYGHAFCSKVSELADKLIAEKK